MLLRGEEQPQWHIQLALLVVLVVQEARLLHLLRILVVLQVPDKR
jgi:hypothetical protein